MYAIRSYYDNGIHRAGLLAEATVNALEEIDVVACCAPGAVLALFRLDGDGERRTHGLAQLAGDAAFLPVGVAAQGMQPAEAARLRGLLLRVLHGELAPEQVAPGYAQALAQFAERQSYNFV